MATREKEYRQAASDRDELEQENDVLRAQLSKGAADTDFSVEHQQLLFDKQALEKKLRKFASHCQALEDEKEQMGDLVGAALSLRITDGNMSHHVGALCDKYTSLQGQCAALSKQLQGQEGAVSRVRELEGVVSTLRKESEELRQKVAEAESKSSQDANFKVAYLEKENLQLISDLQELKGQLHASKTELNNLRLASLQDSPPPISQASSDGNILAIGSAEMTGLPDEGFVANGSSSPLSIRHGTSVQSFDSSESSSKKRSAQMLGDKTPKKSRFSKPVGGSSKKSEGRVARTLALVKPSRKDKNGKTGVSESDPNSIFGGAARVPKLGDGGPEGADRPPECNQS